MRMAPNVFPPGVAPHLEKGHNHFLLINDLHEFGDHDVQFFLVAVPNGVHESEIGPLRSVDSLEFCGTWDDAPIDALANISLSPGIKVKPLVPAGDGLSFRAGEVHFLPATPPPTTEPAELPEEVAKAVAEQEADQS